MQASVSEMKMERNLVSETAYMGTPTDFVDEYNRIHPNEGFNESPNEGPNDEN